MMTDAIDDAATALLRRLIADADAGDIVFTRCDVRDDADGQRARLSWGPPGAATTTTAAEAEAEAAETTTTICANCGKDAERVAADEGGGVFCRHCDITSAP